MSDLFNRLSGDVERDFRELRGTSEGRAANAAFFAERNEQRDRNNTLDVAEMRDFIQKFSAIRSDDVTVVVPGSEPGTYRMNYGSVRGDIDIRIAPEALAYAEVNGGDRFRVDVPRTEIASRLARRDIVDEREADTLILNAGRGATATGVTGAGAIDADRMLQNEAERQSANPADRMTRAEFNALVAEVGREGKTLTFMPPNERGGYRIGIQGGQPGLVLNVDDDVRAEIEQRRAAPAPAAPAPAAPGERPVPAGGTGQPRTGTPQPGTDNQEPPAQPQPAQPAAAAPDQRYGTARFYPAGGQPAPARERVTIDADKVDDVQQLLLNAGIPIGNRRNPTQPDNKWGPATQTGFEQLAAVAQITLPANLNDPAVMTRLTQASETVRAAGGMEAYRAAHPEPARSGEPAAPAQPGAGQPGAAQPAPAETGRTGQPTDLPPPGRDGATATVPGTPPATTVEAARQRIESELGNGMGSNEMRVAEQFLQRNTPQGQSQVTVNGDLSVAEQGAFSRLINSSTDLAALNDLGTALARAGVADAHHAQAHARVAPPPSPDARTVSDTPQRLG